MFDVVCTILTIILNLDNMLYKSMCVTLEHYLNST